MLYYNTIIYDVLYNGKWYRIDSLTNELSLYESTPVPAEVAKMANSAVLDVVEEFISKHTDDLDSQIRNLTEQALSGVFEKVKFIEDNVMYDAAF